MTKLSYHRAFTILIIGFSVVMLSFHIFQIYSHLNSATNLPAQRSFIYKLFTPEQEIHSTKVLFLGDVMLGRNVEYLSSINGVGYSTEQISENLPPVDAVIANFESAMAVPHVRTPSFITTFSTASWMLSVLSKLEVTHASLANNHSLDYGEIGHQNAVARLQDIGIIPFGHLSETSTSSVIVTDSSVRIGVIAINSIYVRPKESQLQLQIHEMKKDTDVQIAYIHWGDEYELVHNDAQEALARSLAAMGIDVIVGHHPHVVQDVGIVDGALVFYSLGNFIFDQYFSTEVQTGYALVMEATDKNKLSFSIIPVTSIDSRSQPRLMTTEETASFLNSLSKRSSPTLQAGIMENSLTWEANLAHE